jgi:cyclophilin family peptidyl-prolyl cis-trans isomerase
MKRRSEIREPRIEGLPKSEVRTRATGARPLAKLTIPALLLGLLVSSPAGAGTLAQFRTVFGTMDVELLDADKPVTVGNFIRYVEAGRYRDSILHRCPVNPVTLRSDFVIQGGGYVVTGRGTTNPVLDSVPKFPDIPNEFAVGRRFSNTYGTLAMAKRGGDTNSASSEWFFNLKDNSFLDAADTNNLFVVFGRVLRGTNVLEQFKSFHAYTGRETSNLVYNLDPTNPYSPFTELPLLRPSLAETSLVFVDVSLLTVQVQPNGAGQPVISWPSASNALNVVEFATHAPTGWQVLSSLNGNGNLLSVTDAAPGTAPRFYRVRIDL